MICRGSTSAGMRVDCRLSDDLMADYAVNELMQPVHEAVQGTLAVTSLRPDLQEIVDAGPVRRSGRIYLSHYARGRQRAAAAIYQFTAERWVKDVQAESSWPACDPAWRPHVLPGVEPRPVRTIKCLRFGLLPARIRASGLIKRRLRRFSLPKDQRAEPADELHRSGDGSRPCRIAMRGCLGEPLLPGDVLGGAQGSQGRLVRPAPSRPSGDDEDPPAVLQQSGDFPSFADQRGGRILAEFGPQARLRSEDTVVHRQLTPPPVLCLLAGPQGQSCLAQEVAMLVELRRPARRGGRELPGGEDEAGPRPQDAGDLRSNPSLVWKEPERIDAHGPIETGRGQACGRGVTDQEAGSLPEPELQRPAPGARPAQSPPRRSRSRPARHPSSGQPTGLGRRGRRPGRP